MRVDGDEILLEHLGAGVAGGRRRAAREGTRDRHHGVRAGNAVAVAVGHHAGGRHQGLLGLGRVREHVQRDHVAVGGRLALLQGLGARARRVVVDYRVLRYLDPVVVQDLAVLLLVHGVLLLLEAPLGDVLLPLLLLVAPAAAQVVRLVPVSGHEGRVHDPFGIVGRRPECRGPDRRVVR